ncbi:hypothetical protein BX616_007747 [Lobosporangium transversale]|uniref:Uncharacterized protein n=1 Tax=Lobosporangium transversale TaxID=64571 RepID=A0A1Y2GQV2_9FUNG|nr:hypothetical protein BCR41DRAFT_422360 [Lobosporangium transversale]KAF9914698.1 hypothetical protein BX616_007747 [Lobosporangium transversale]ORZ14838.1 hypothetical protein BCR41DRAFT_422360 [Lobosporangium transversale]|eukprot:XP_021880970.1 hypothetical protein BCR41DRAFT_422360 [Lobosporangium transversale]
MNNQDATDGTNLRREHHPQWEESGQRPNQQSSSQSPIVVQQSALINPFTATSRVTRQSARLSSQTPPPTAIETSGQERAHYELGSLHRSKRFRLHGQPALWSENPFNLNASPIRPWNSSFETLSASGSSTSAHRAQPNPMTTASDRGISGSNLSSSIPMKEESTMERDIADIMVDEQSPLWIIAGRKALLKLKHGVGHVQDMDSSGGTTEPFRRGANQTHTLREDFSAHSSSGSRQNDYEKPVSSSPNEPSDVRDKNYEGKDDDNSNAHLSNNIVDIGTDYSYDYNQSQSQNQNQDVAINVDEELQSMEERVQQKLRKLMANSGKTKASWSSSTSAGQISRDGREGETFFQYRSIGGGESSLSSISSPLLTSSSRGHQYRRRYLEDQEAAPELMAVDDLEVTDSMQEPEKEGDLEPEQKSKIEQEARFSEIWERSESEDTLIKRTLEAELEVELEVELDSERAGYKAEHSKVSRQISNNELNLDSALELPINLPEVLVTRDELESRFWMYGPRIAKPQRMFL